MRVFGFHFLDVSHRRWTTVLRVSKRLDRGIWLAGQVFDRMNRKVNAKLSGPISHEDVPLGVAYRQFVEYKVLHSGWRQELSALFGLNP